MAKIFLDANSYIDVVYRRPEILKNFLFSTIYFSPLSTHILFYALKIKIPCEKIIKITDEFQIVDLTGEIFSNALKGPTSDLEDNIQLHSAAIVDCDYFITNDKKLLSLKFFGKVKIVDSVAT